MQAAATSSTPAEAPAAEAASQQQQQEQQLVLQVIRSDWTPRSMYLLTQFRDLLSTQLPEMPKEYIHRVTFNREHESMILLRGRQVCGGACFRPFASNGFVELVFLAISFAERGKGMGTLVVNHLKSYLQKCNLLRILTYADDTAIDFFKKQGFAAHVTLKSAKWKGYIKDYTMAQLMECLIYPQINYLAQKKMLSDQHKVAKERADKFKRRIIFDGIKDFKEGKTKRLRLDQVPGLERLATRFAPPDGASVESYVDELLSAFYKHKDAWPFHNPVTEDTAPHYFDIVKKPMDYTRLKAKNDQLQYKSLDEFVADMELMCDNCRAYNSPDTVFFQCAARVERWLMLRLSKDGAQVQRKTSSARSSRKGGTTKSKRKVGQ